MFHKLVFASESFFHVTKIISRDSHHFQLHKKNTKMAVNTQNVFLILFEYTYFGFVWVTGKRTKERSGRSKNIVLFFIFIYILCLCIVLFLPVYLSIYVSASDSEHKFNTLEGIKDVNGDYTI